MAPTSSPKNADPRIENDVGGSEARPRRARHQIKMTEHCPRPAVVAPATLENLEMPIDPLEDPPIKPGQPSEPPQESPPGNPRPEVPPPMQDPGESPQPEELPGRTPDELPVRGPEGPRAPSATAISDLPAL
jgi:hypothetical protein